MRGMGNLERGQSSRLERGGLDGPRVPSGAERLVKAMVRVIKVKRQFLRSSKLKTSMVLYDVCSVTK